MVVVGGCSTALRLVERDIDSAIVMAKAAGTEQETRCFEALRGAIDKIEQIDALDADGIVAATYKAWLLRHYREGINEALRQMCLPVISGIGAHLMLR